MNSGMIYKTKDEIRSLFNELGITYISQPEIEVAEPVIPLEQTDYFLENKEEFQKLAASYGGKIREGEIAQVYVKKISDDIGYGVFAASDLPKGTFLGEYTGVIKIADHCAGNENDGEYATDYSWDYPDFEDGMELEIDARRKGNETRFINHDFEANVDIDHTVIDNLWRLFFITNREIKKDTQILACYGEDYWVGGFREIIL